MNSAEPLVPRDDLDTHHYFIATLRQGLKLTGQISRRDWDNAVDAARRYKDKLDQESGAEPLQESASDSERF